MQKELEITKSLDLAELKDVANVEGPCITVYMPLQAAPNTSRFDFARLNSPIRQIEQKLSDWDLPAGKVREIIDPLKGLESEADRWGGDGGSLVIWRSPGMLKVVQVKEQVDESVTVANHFRVLPLLRHLQAASEVLYLLALSQNRVRLLRCTNQSVEELPLGESTPTSLEQWLNTRMPNAAPDHGAVQEPGTGSTAGAFTSTTDRDNKDEHIANFFRVINRAVFDILRNEKYPLVLCGVDYERAMYKGINQYQHLMEEGVQGSPESLKGGEMHARALEVVQAFFATPAKKAITLWEKIAGTDRAITSFPDVVKAAFEGRVAHLFVVEGSQSMGVFDKNTMEMKVSGRQEDLTNAAALQTIAFGGDVFVVAQNDLPGGGKGGQMSAITRY